LLDRSRTHDFGGLVWGINAMAKLLIKVSAALAAMIWAAAAALAQTTPFIKVPHGRPYKGSLPAAPAMSLKNVPLLPAEAAGQIPKVTFVGPHGTVLHIFPTPWVAVARHQAMVAHKLVGQRNSNLAGGPLEYHSGGSVMLPYDAVYNIYWAPPTLQDGTATGFSSLYGTVTVLHNAWLPGHGLLNIATQYYQDDGVTTTYVVNGGGLGGFVVDNGAYPASGCSDIYTPNDCITDAQIQTKIAAVMTAQGWTGGMNKVFVLYTSSGEGSCHDNTNSSCAYVQYCGYHSYFLLNGQPVIYVNVPYGDIQRCSHQDAQTFPNDPPGDVAANVTSHEIMEATTDPLFDAWFDASGNEIGDLCAYNFGTNMWNNGLANQMWNGWFFEDQQEYDNHTSSCVQVGP
jgi:hypothetical protein